MRHSALVQLNLDDLPAKRRYLIGVSGGRDSVALLHALHGLGFARLVVCHVNHRLRGRASTQDAAFVQRLATRLGYPCEMTSVDVSLHAKEARLSIETTAREVRHEFFAAMARKHRCPRVLLAHHADDQAETVLMRVLRGTGIGGLAGMKAVAPLEIGLTTLALLRPMLTVRRTEIDTYVATHHLRYREDATNTDTQPTRNRVRQALLPQLGEAIGRDVAPMLLRLAKNAAADDDLLQGLTESLIQKEGLLDGDGNLLLKPALKQAPPALQHRVVHHWLRQRDISDINYDVIASIVKLMTQRDPARINLAQGLQVRRKSGRLSVAAQSPHSV